MAIGMRLHAFPARQMPLGTQAMDNLQEPVATSRAPASFRYFDLVMAAFVAILLLSNVIGAAKLSFVEVPWWPQGWWPAADGLFIFGAGILFFPVSYVIGDVLTEVYGYARARRVIWTGFAALIFMAVMTVWAYWGGE